MNIPALVRTDHLRPKTAEPAKIRSLLDSIERNSKVALAIPLNGDTATVIFRELYESIRQLGDAAWWQRGYEPRNHDVYMELLREMPVKNQAALRQLPRYKAIRHDINYRGFRASEAQAGEIVEFWNTNGKELLALLRAQQKSPSSGKSG